MAGLVNCKVCNKEMAKGVNKCPNCGKDQRNWFMQHKILTFFGAIIIIAILSSMLGGGDNKDSEKSAVSDGSKAKENAKEEEIYKIGDVINAKKLEVSITKVEEFDQIGDPTFLGKVAPEGATLVAIQYTMKNISEEPVGMFSYPSIKLVDEKGTKYSTDIDASSSYATETKVDNSKVLSDLNPDITVTGVDAFEVSKEKFAQGKWYIQVGDSKVLIKE